MSYLKQGLTTILSRHSLDVDKIDLLKSSVNNKASYLENPYRFKLKKMNSPQVDVDFTLKDINDRSGINLPQIQTNFIKRNVI